MGESRHRAALGILLGAAALSAGRPAEQGWTRWGGPRGDFTLPASPLAAAWPSDGPRRIWDRELGDGYSAILYEEGRLYTMYRGEGKEVVVALDAATGRTLWQHRYDAAPRAGHVAQFGEGPRATPLISGAYVYAIGVSGKMHCLRKSDGHVVWRRELWGDDLQGNVLNHGYSSSPIAYKDTVIALVGGPGRAIVAFDKKTGEIAWRALDFENSYSTPEILAVHGEDQLVAFMAREVIGVDPNDGTLHWRYAHENRWRQNISQPILVDRDLLFISSPQAGARGLRLAREGRTVRVEELWSAPKIEFYHVTTVRKGDYVFGSTGTLGPAFLAAVNLRDGTIAWRERGFARANCLLVGERMIILDEDGRLTLATPTPQSLTVHAAATVVERVAWTVPTLVGRTMYVRSQRRIMALDLG